MNISKLTRSVLINTISEEITKQEKYRCKLIKFGDFDEADEISEVIEELIDYLTQLRIGE